MPIFPTTDTTQFDSIESKNWTPEITVMDKLGADFDLAQEYTPLSMAAEWSKMEQLKEQEKEKNSPLLSPEELNNKYPLVERKFDEPMYDSVANELQDRAIERQRNRRLSAMGPQSKFNSVLGFGAGVLAHALDPVEMAVNLGTSFGVGTLGKMMLSGATAHTARAAVGTALSMPTGVIRNVTEGLISGAAVEGAIVNPLSNAQMKEYSFKESMLNIFVASAGLSATFKGIGKSAHFIKENAPNVAGTMMKTGVGQAINDLRPNLKPIIESIDKMNYRGTIPKAMVGTYKPIIKGAKTLPKEQVLYAAAKVRQETNIKTMGARVIGDDRGKGIYLSDPQVANGMSANHYNDVRGGVVEIPLENQKIFKMDVLAEPGTQQYDELTEVIEQVIGKELATIAGGNKLRTIKTVSDLMNAVDDLRAINAVDENVFDSINKELGNKGYDGTFYYHKSQSGDDVPVAMIFNDKKLRPKGSVDADPAHLPKVTEQDIDSAKAYSMDPRSNMFRDIDMEERVFKDIESPILEDTEIRMTETKEEISLLEEEFGTVMKDMDRENVTGLRGIEQDVKKLDTFAKEVKEEAGIMDLAVKCRIGSR